MVGDWFRVFNYFPNRELSQHRVSPFLLLDFNAEIDFSPSDHIRGVGVHPHKGFETVTIVYKGSVAQGGQCCSIALGRTDPRADRALWAFCHEYARRVGGGDAGIPYWEIWFVEIDQWVFPAAS
jgi:hypothetical protein